MGLQWCWVECTNKRDDGMVQIRPFLRVRERGSTGIAMSTKYIGQGSHSDSERGWNKQAIVLPWMPKRLPIFYTHQIAPDKELVKMLFQALASACKDWSAIEKACSLTLLTAQLFMQRSHGHGTQEAAHECIPDQ